jgi:hypothetical protein
MPQLLGPEDGAKEVSIGDSVVATRGKDGVFNVDNPAVATLMRKSGDFTTRGIRIGAGARGFKCQDCGFVAIIKDSCGRCGGSDLKAES